MMRQVNLTQLKMKDAGKGKNVDSVDGKLMREIPN
jgi:hypothetical protein